MRHTSIITNVRTGITELKDLEMLRQHYTLCRTCNNINRCGRANYNDTPNFGAIVTKCEKYTLRK